METKANYIAVGAFVVACLAGIVIAALWIVGNQFQNYAYYQSVFVGSVSGIGKGTAVRYNGIEAGRVYNLEPDPKNPEKQVLVTLQIDPRYPIRQKSTATISSTGLAGAAYVEIDGGDPGSPMLASTDDHAYRYPLIPFKPSTMQQLEKSLPEAITKIDKVAEDLTIILGAENQGHIKSMLAHLDKATGALANRSDDIEATISNAKELTASLTKTSNRLQLTLARADTTFDNVDGTLKDFGKLARDTDDFVNSDGVAQISDLVSEVRRLTNNLTKFSDQLNREPTRLLFGDRRKGYEPKGGSK